MFQNWLQKSKMGKKKVGLYTKDILDLDLDWSRLSRPPGLISGKEKCINQTETKFLERSRNIVLKYA